jgi:hypothetical protein
MEVDLNKDIFDSLAANEENDFLDVKLEGIFLIITEYCEFLREKPNLKVIQITGICRSEQM